jgi:hypothetical protein
VGGEAKLTFPIYPEFKTPKFRVKVGTNIAGISLDGGAEGSIKVYGPIGKKYKLL